MADRKSKNHNPSVRPRARDLKPDGDDLGAVLVSMLAALPRVEVKKKPHSTGFSVGKKLFAFTTKRSAVILKLPVETVQVLVESNTAARVVMGKRVMKEWVVINYKSPAESRKHLDLFRKALAFVSSQ